MLASYVRKWLEINGTPEKVEKIVGYCIRKENLINSYEKLIEILQ